MPERRLAAVAVVAVAALLPLAAGFIAAAAVVAVPTPAAHAAAAAATRHRDNDWLDRLFGRRKRVEASRVIPWSHASGKPDTKNGPGEGVYVWHDRNTVHLWAVGSERRRIEFNGWIEVRGGKLDTLQDDRSEGDDEFRQVGERRVLWTLTAGREPHGFRFNIKPGDKLVVQAEVNGRRLDNIYLGKTMTDSRGNPVTFALEK